MTLKNNTILITGGSSGIGLELAKQLQTDNKVLICGRTLEKLERTKQSLPGVEYLQCNISKTEECEKLQRWIRDRHPDCNILINNAAIVHRQNFFEDDGILEKARAELQTNLMGPIRLAKLLSPLLLKNQHPKIVNITTGLAYVPRGMYPFYSATKAALHSFTQVLRYQAESIRSPLVVIEALLPVVDTPFHNGNPPNMAITPDKAVEEMLKKIEKGNREIRVGKVKLLYLLYRIAPGFAFRKINSLS